jgi:hypothetical protein
MYGSVKSGLAWELCKSKVKDLVAYAVTRLNLHRTSIVNSSMHTCVRFTGIRNWKKEAWWHLEIT